MDCAFYLIQFIFFDIIYQHTDSIGGFNREQMYIFITSYLFIDALNMTFFANNIWWFPRIVNKGELDYYLIRPVSALFFLSLREFAANSFINLLISFSLVIWSLSNYSGEISTLGIILYFCLLFNGLFIHYILNFFFVLSSLWTNSASGNLDLFYSLSHACERPDLIYQGKIRFLFLYILPFALIASFPVRVLFEKNYSFLILQSLLTSAILFLILIYFWSRGLRRYNSASS
ncbi:ABC transporter permease [Bacteriovoracaceae bacterium]|nr:ABC transporter permease [Bacteriovoracaceae bacterium]